MEPINPLTQLKRINLAAPDVERDCPSPAGDEVSRPVQELGTVLRRSPARLIPSVWADTSLAAPTLQ
jgi:hypothetical protein